MSKIPKLINAVRNNLYTRLYLPNDYLNKMVQFIEKEINENDKDGIDLLTNLIDSTNFDDTNSSLSELELYLSLNKTTLFNVKKTETPDYKIASNNGELRLELYTPSVFKELKDLLAEVKNISENWDYSVEVILNLNENFSKYKKDQLITFIENNIKKVVMNGIDFKKEIFFTFNNEGKLIDTDGRIENTSQLQIWPNESFKFSSFIGIEGGIISDRKPEPSDFKFHADSGNPTFVDLRRKIINKITDGQLEHDDFGLFVVNHSEDVFIDLNIGIHEIMLGPNMIDTKTMKRHIDYSGVYQKELISQYIKGGIIFIKRNYTRMPILSGDIFIFNKKIREMFSNEIEEIIKLLYLCDVLKRGSEEVNE